MRSFTSATQAIGYSSFFVALSALMSYLTYDNLTSDEPEYHTYPVATAGVLAITVCAIGNAIDYFTGTGKHEE
ncbi:hypothetical protein Trichorick_01332 [Candidatus Trichorickettsia mobilis]|uniref:Uncharacterized protein n=1 Tax=Candidatus Trichorickettsia mobilis TaxID=1346319 RepID=A0ABZ0UW54_9RICK|nr:hypothetical protein [Candidatus Trichorickettsia mobilis]WPY01420.1 hypothetical protein Trichorick_01332 [Candidatus Trichorickettsia mobilis]